MEQANLPELPEEMIVRILCCLPVQSLIRFTCVSKRFRSIILSDPKFAKSQFQAARDRKALTRRLLYTVERDPNPKSIDLETLSSVGNLNFPSQSAAGYVSILGSCSGIVFLAVNHQVYYMWNPSTGFSKALPDPVIEDHGHAIFSGVGYMPATNDYRVVVAYCGYYGDYCRTIHDAAVFSSRANAWETLKFEDLDIVYYEGTLLKETLHWIGFYLGIVAFDLTQQDDHKFRKMLLPKAFSVDRPSFYDIFLSAGECLLLAHRLKECIHVWVMREYDVPDSWTKFFSLKFSGPPKEQWSYSWGCVLVMETSTVFTILVGDKDEPVLTKILHEGGECSFYKIEGLFGKVIYLQPSLLPIDD